MITKYTHDIKSNIYVLVLINVIVDFDELSIRILDGLNPRYKGLADAIVTQENLIIFDELFEKLLSYETNLLTSSEPPISSSSVAAIPV